MSKTAGRLLRAAANFRETFGLFAVSVSGRAAAPAGHSSAIGAQLYFWARLVYVPVYALGIQMVRTLVWAVSIVGLVMVLLGRVRHRLTESVRRARLASCGAATHPIPACR